MNGKGDSPRPLSVNEGVGRINPYSRGARII